MADLVKIAPDLRTLIFQATPWDITNLNTIQWIHPGDFTSIDNIDGIFFKPDGTKMYILDANFAGTEGVEEWSLSTPWDISTAAFTAQMNTENTAHNRFPRGLFISSDGKKVFVPDNDTPYIALYTLSTAWDITTGSYTSKSLFSNSGLVDPYGLSFKPDGKKVYLNFGLNGSSADVDVIQEWDLSTAWDISTAAFNDSRDFSGEFFTSGIRDSWWKPDGTEFFVLGRTSVGAGLASVIRKYTVSTAWDITALTFDSEVTLPSSDRFVNGLFFKPDGISFWTTSSDLDRVWEFKLHK